MEWVFQRRVNVDVASNGKGGLAFKGEGCKFVRREGGSTKTHRLYMILVTHEEVKKQACLA